MSCGVPGESGQEREFARLAGLWWSNLGNALAPWVPTRASLSPPVRAFETARRNLIMKISTSRDVGVGLLVIRWIPRYNASFRRSLPFLFDDARPIARVVRS